MARWNLTFTQRFWFKVDRSGGPRACWPWLAGLDTYGYGAFRLGARTEGSIGAHRLAWLLTYQGPILPGAVFRHFVCDNPPCCNPAHVYPGTHQDNMRDMVAAGRQAIGDRNSRRLYPERYPHGQRHWAAKLTPTLVLEIIRLYQRGSATNGLGRIAQRFGVSKPTIQRIVTGKTWTHLGTRG